MNKTFLRHNDNEVFIPENENINSLLKKAEQRFKNNIAVIFNGRRLTYNVLAKKADQMAAYLVKNGVGKGDVIALYVDRSLEMLVSLLAILRTGAAYLPLDPEFPTYRIRFMLEDAAAKKLIASSKYIGKFKGTYEINVDTLWPNLENITPLSEIQINGSNLAYILYTSGSTGKPKGVKITHRNMVNFLLSMQQEPGIKETDRLLAITTISFDIAGLEMYLPLLSGAQLVIADADSTKDGRLLLKLVEDEHISMMQATPTTWQMMLDSGWDKHYDLKILCGGEPLPNKLAADLMCRSNELWNMYGPTETTIWSTVKRITDADTTITVGKPINNTQVYILDANNNPMPQGEEGEICIGGYGVASGYLNRDELTREKFIPDPFGNKNNKLYKTGDLGRILDNGEVLCIGRVDHQVKIRGHRIELVEIEAAVAKLQGIKQVVVVPNEDNLLGRRLIAYVVPEQADNTTEIVNLPDDIIKRWREELALALPPYMIPEEFIGLMRFPMTTNAKVDRKALPKPANAPRLDIRNMRAMTAGEQLVANIWKDVLGIGDIGPEDDFFQIGGHSLLAVKVMVAIEKKTGKRLTITTLFNNPTVEKLAKSLADDDAVKGWNTLVPLKTTGNKSPLFMVHGAELNLLLFKPIVEHIGDDQPVYGFQGIGISHPTEVPATIEGIAKSYVAEMVAFFPQGPYVMTGYSMGGFIAIEMAKQLIEMGKQVAFVGLMDSYAGDRITYASKADYYLAKFIRQFRKLGYYTKAFIEYPLGALDYQIFAAKSRLKKLIKNKDEALSDIPKDILFTDYEAELYRKYVKALHSYQLKPVNFPITLFRVKKRLYYVDNSMDLGWKKFATGGLTVRPVPGDHRTFMLPPNNKSFAATLQSEIDKSLRR